MDSTEINLANFSAFIAIEMSYDGYLKIKNKLITASHTNTLSSITSLKYKIMSNEIIKPQ